ncbi:MAG TPA: hypothetical protein VL424_03500 [Pararobbsia sp.]|nr:hypothetical protein [Pararobbsia sp.]
MSTGAGGACVDGVAGGNHVANVRRANGIERRGPASAALAHDTLNLLAAMEAMHYDVVARNAERVDQMLERFELMLRRGDPFPDGAFVEDVIRPFVTWLTSLTYLPDDGDFSEIGQCARSLLRHVPMDAPESTTQKTLARSRPFREFGSTERLDSHEDAAQVAHSLVDWTIPLLYRFVVLLKCLATGEPCTDTWRSLLEAIERHEHLPGASTDTSESGSQGRVEPRRAPSPHPMALRSRVEPLYASIRPRDVIRGRQASQSGSSSSSSSSLEAVYNEPFDCVQPPPSPHGHASVRRQAKPACRDVATQTESPSWIGDLKRDPNWRTNPLWWGPVESIERLDLQHHDAHAEPESYC